MASPLNFKASGIPKRTPRSQARAHGTKVPELPRIEGYCPAHGMPETTCKTNDVDAAAEEVSRSGGTNKAATTLKPFNLRGA